MTRADHIREIVGHLDALVGGLDGADHQCESCGLHVKDNWPESNAKSKLAESRKKFAKMLGESWVGNE